MDQWGRGAGGGAPAAPAERTAARSSPGAGKRGRRRIAGRRRRVAGDDGHVALRRPAALGGGVVAGREVVVVDVDRVVGVGVRARVERVAHDAEHDAADHERDRRGEEPGARVAVAVLALEAVAEDPGAGAHRDAAEDPEHEAGGAVRSEGGRLVLRLRVALDGLLETGAEDAHGVDVPVLLERQRSALGHQHDARARPRMVGRRAASERRRRDEGHDCDACSERSVHGRMLVATAPEGETQGATAPYAPVGRTPPAVADQEPAADPPPTTRRVDGRRALRHARAHAKGADAKGHRSVRRLPDHVARRHPRPPPAGRPAGRRARPLPPGGHVGAGVPAVPRRARRRSRRDPHPRGPAPRPGDHEGGLPAPSSPARALPRGADRGVRHDRGLVRVDGQARVLAALRHGRARDRGPLRAGVPRQLRRRRPAHARGGLLCPGHLGGRHVHGRVLPAPRGQGLPDHRDHPGHREGRDLPRRHGARPALRPGRAARLPALPQGGDRRRDRTRRPLAGAARPDRDRGRGLQRGVAHARRGAHRVHRPLLRLRLALRHGGTDAGVLGNETCRSASPCAAAFLFADRPARRRRAPSSGRTASRRSCSTIR